MFDKLRQGFKDAAVKRRRSKLIKNILPAAKEALLANNRFLINSSVFEDIDQIQLFIVLLGSAVGSSIRASHSNGTLVVYPDDNMDGTNLIIGEMK
jgi:hypothetical protein